MTHIAQCRAVQQQAKKVLARLGDTITASSTEKSITEDAVRLLAEERLTKTWYYACPAFVLLGSRSCLSISGKVYEPSDEQVGDTNVVTVDLSPLDGDAMGDCARTFCVESGRVTAAPLSAEFDAGIRMEHSLHAAIREYAKPSTTMHELWEFANDLIAANGFENLDFLGNVGHSLALDRTKRQFIEKGNRFTLGDALLFTFEPHIRRRDGQWGYKHENVYCFGSDGRIEEL